MGSASTGTALDAGNRVFHEAYGGARDHVRDQVPILVVLPNELAFHHQGQRRVVPYSCASFAAAKSAAHIAVALYALACPEVDASQRDQGVARLLSSIAAALDSAPADLEPVDSEIAALLEHCRGFAQSGRKQLWSEERRTEFASGAGPRILQITESATNDQIAGLHGATEGIFALLSPADRANLQVVVVGDHQARARSLGMQYFKRRLDEPLGVDLRVTYGENITDEEEAIALVGTRRLDRRIAKDFFGDATRLQRDVLGDAAKRCIDQMSFPT